MSKTGKTSKTTKFTYLRDNLSSPARTVFYWYGQWNSLALNMNTKSC